MTVVWKNHRHVTPEIMDKPDVPAAPHVLALDGLRRINRSSHAAYHVAKADHRNGAAQEAQVDFDAGYRLRGRRCAD